MLPALTSDAIFAYSLTILKKQEIRKQFLHQRLMLSEVEYEDLNRLLLEQFTKLDLSNISCIHMFLPIKERREPDTFLIRDWLKQNHPSIKIAYPKANFANHTMESFVDDADLELIINGYGIPEPVAGNTIDPHEIDMMLVPLLAFDERGYRAGYGKGFYDRFMAQCGPHTQFIGISFFEPVDLIEDVDEHDFKMHRCITPNRVYEWQF